MYVRDIYCFIYLQSWNFAGKQPFKLLDFMNWADIRPSSFCVVITER